MIGNRVTEKDVRLWLDRHGYYGRSARFHELELEAIQRPGWIQVFRFHVTAKHQDGEWVDLHGVVRDDERERRLDQKTRVAVFDERAERDQLMADWSQNLIRKRTEPVSRMAGLLALTVALLALAIGLVRWLR